MAAIGARCRASDVLEEQAMVPMVNPAEAPAGSTSTGTRRSSGESVQQVLLPEEDGCVAEEVAVLLLAEAVAFVFGEHVPGVAAVFANDRHDLLRLAPRGGGR